MKRNLLESAINYLNNTTDYRIAHLVILELAASTVAAPAYIYLTDYPDAITYDGKVYEPNKVTKVGTVRQTQGLTNYKLNITVAGEWEEELARALVENGNTSYVGKDITVLRAYLDDAGNIIPFDKDTNGPMEYFYGDITDINVKEGVSNNVSDVTWSCAGKFQDFELVNGRMTDDIAHRGLISDGQGNYVPSDGAKRLAYQSDTGFQHANQTINVVSKYTAKETRYKMKSSWFGLKSKLKEYTVDVEKELELGVDLNAKYLPRVYGVRRVPGIPVFIDTKRSDANEVYIVYAFCEGEIDAFLNFYIGSEPCICLNSTTANAKVCLGNQENGDTLSAFISAAGQEDLRDLSDSRVKTRPTLASADSSVLSAPTLRLVEESIRRTERYESTGVPINSFVGDATVTRTEGTRHLDTFDIVTDSGSKWIQVFHGKPDQEACQTLVSLAAANNFLLQKDWTPEAGNTKASYWDSNSKLLDTAYVVMKMRISGEETEIPQLEAVVSGACVSTFDSAGNETVNQYSLNPVWHLLDYMTNPICGGGLTIDKVDLASFANVAAVQDEITSTYDNDFLRYWRYVGWKTAPVDQTSIGDDPQKTKMQCNTVVETKEPVNKNIQMLLEQFDGTINIVGNKYQLTIENDDAAIAFIDILDVIGAIETKDLSATGKWNSIEASIIDPGLDWATNQINFFNNDYLVQDKGIPKKGRVVFNCITNYYTAREWAQRQLAKSRFSREITMLLPPKYVYLEPNSNVTFSYARFSYDNKKFRVKSTDLQDDGTIRVTLQDYDSSMFNTNDSPQAPETDVVNPVPQMPANLTYVQLPDPNFPYANDDYGVFGLLIWDIPENDTSIMRYDVRDWLDEATDYIVPLTNKIQNTSTGIYYYYMPVAAIQAETDYIFKVRTIAKSGYGSKYAILRVTTGTGLTPATLPAVTNIQITGLTEFGEFSGSDVTLTWQAGDSSSTQYNIQVLDENDNIISTSSGNQYHTVTGTETFTYTYTINKADYASNHGGVLGAYRKLKFRVRAYNGVVYSNWTEY